MKAHNLEESFFINHKIRAAPGFKSNQNILRIGHLVAPFQYSSCVLCSLMFRILLIAFCAAVAHAGYRTYKDYKILRVPLKNASAYETLLKLDSLDYLELLTDGHGGHIDVLVSPESYVKCAGLLDEVEEVVGNVQLIVDAENLLLSSSTPLPSGEFSYDTYHTLDVIYAHLDALQTNHSEIAQTFDLPGLTYEERSIKAIRITKNISSPESDNKPMIWIDGGVHAREWASPSTVTYIIDSLLGLEEKNRSTEMGELLDMYQFVIAPCINPDGYEHTKIDRFWRKNRKPSGCKAGAKTWFGGCFYQSCFGSDPNRNWGGAHWNSSGVSNNPCSNVYPGTAPFDQPNTHIVKTYLETKKSILKMYLSYHSHSQTFLTPVGYSEEVIPADQDYYQRVGLAVVAAISARHGTEYTAQRSAYLYPHSGDSADWANLELGVTDAYTIELRDEGAYGFAVPTDQIKATAEENVDGLLALVQNSQNLKRNSVEIPDYYQMGPGTLRIPNSMFKENRERICQRLSKNTGPGHVLFFEGGAQTQQYDTDRDIEFQQESYFMWLFGVMEADFYGAIDVDNCTSYLFMPRLPASYAVWMGVLKTPDFFKKRYSVDNVFYSDEIGSILAKLRPSSLMVMNGVNSDSQASFAAPTFDGIDQFKVDDTTLYNEIAECRVTKSDAEMKVMRYVNQISCEAHIEVMKMMKPGRMEYEGEATFKHYSYMKGGMRHVGYTCICASGGNGAVLHYGHAGEPNDKLVLDGDMLLFDMGSEYAGYTADITVSWPVNGRFTDNQRFVYNTCLKANRAVLAAMKPGVSWIDMHRLAERTILEEFIKEGLLINGTLEEMIAVHMGAIFMPHGLGHLIGLDVHDVGGYINAPSRIDEPGIKSLRTTRTLEKGMVITVEPGVYFGDALIEAAYESPEQSKFMNKARIEQFRGMGGVRIEDGVAVTEDGSELLSHDLPRTVEEIEAFFEKLSD